jgi:hypothetical protein
MSTTVGKRLPDGEIAQHPFQPGAYGRVPRSGGEWTWYACVPEGGMLANLSAHEVTEHEDGTITAEPSILVHGGEGREWHGYLEHGEWRSV